MNINKVTIAGRLGRDPEIKETQGGLKIARLGVATNRVWKNKEGTKQEETIWHTIIFFSKRAETIAQYFKKGQEIYVEGYIKSRTWEDNEGKKHYATDIIGEDFQFVGSKAKDAYTPPVTEAPPQATQTAQASEEIDLSDIPF